jgi:uncharacterized protein with HEPN domain
MPRDCSVYLDDILVPTEKIQRYGPESVSAGAAGAS